MLSMSSDTIESYGSREMTHVDYGYSRSSTPDSSASSRLAAQLERSAYRRSRSKTRRKQSSKQSDVDPVNVSARKPSRNKRLKHQQRSQSYEQDEFYSSTASRLNDSSTSPPIRRSLNLDDEQPTENRAMRKSANAEQYSKERHYDEHEDGQILTALPVSSSYTVSCVSNGYDDYCHTVEPTLRHSETATDAQARRPRVDVTQNGKNGKSPDRKKCFPSNNRNAVPEVQNVYENHVDNKNSRSVNVSRVRFEECWEDSPVRKPDYKVREASGISIRDEIPGHKRSEIQRVANGGIDNTESKIERPVKEKQGKVSLVQDKPTGTKTNGHKEAIVYAKENFTSRKRDVSSSRLDNGNRLDSGHTQSRSEINRTDEAKPLGLRQLIKIHEIQIAEVAKSAASMKRPLSGKAHEGRLVKVKVVPEIETKQSHVKQNAAKVTFAGNKSSSDSPLPRKLPNVESRSKVIEPFKEKEGINVRNEPSIVKARTTVKPKRHTVELRAKPPSQEHQKWKRHTAIGLVGFDLQGDEVPHGEWSPREKDSKKSFTGPDSDAEVEYLRKQPVEPEKQFVDEKIEKSGVTGLKASPVIDERDGVWKEPNKGKPVLDDESEIPPERPPLPENFYSSTEEVLIRPPPPIYTNDFENSSSKLDFKARTDHVPRVEFKPDVEYLPAVDNNPNNEYISTTDKKQNVGYVPIADIETNIEYARKEDFTPNTGFVPKVDFEPNRKCRKKSHFTEQSRSIPLSSSWPAIHVSTAIVQNNDEHILEQNNIQEKDDVLGKIRTTREMYEERLARINLIPLDVSERHLANQELATSLCSSLESFAWDKACNIHNSNKTENLDKLKTCMKKMKVLTKQKEDLEKNFERERRDWKRKYEEQQKVANAYQKLEDRYRRQVQELQEALKLCRCTDMETRKTLFLGHSWKRTEPYLLSPQTQSILDETEEWLKAQSVRSDITYNSANISTTRIQNGQSSHESLTDLMGAESKWAMDYKDVALTTGIDQYNGTSV